MSRDSGAASFGLTVAGGRVGGEPRRVPAEVPHPTLFEAYARDLGLQWKVERAFEVLPSFARQVMDWLDEVPDDDP